MHVHDYDGREGAQIIDDCIGDAKRIVDRRHERASHHIHDTDGDTVDIERPVSASRHGRRIVRRTNDTIARLQVRLEVALVEDVVPRRDEVDPGREHLVGGLRGEAETARRIFAIRDRRLDVVLFANERNATFERVTARRADDVTDQEKFKGFYRRDEAFAFR